MFLGCGVELELNVQVFIHGRKTAGKRMAKTAAVWIQHPCTVLEMGHGDSRLRRHVRAARTDDDQRFAANRVHLAWDIRAPLRRQQQDGAVELAASKTMIEPRTPAGPNDELRFAQRRRRLDEPRVLQMPHQAAREPDPESLMRASHRAVREAIGGAQNFAGGLQDASADRSRAQRLGTAIDQFGADLILEDLKHARNRRLGAPEPARGGAEAPLFENPDECTQSVKVQVASDATRATRVRILTDRRSVRLISNPYLSMRALHEMNASRNDSMQTTHSDIRGCCP